MDSANAAHQALPLVEFAFSIAVGSIARNRCKDNVDIIRENIANLPPREVIKEVNAITAELDRFSKSPKTIDLSLELLKTCKQYIINIKSKLGKNNAFYLQVSTSVVRNAHNSIISNVNALINQIEKISSYIANPYLWDMEHSLAFQYANSSINSSIMSSYGFRNFGQTNDFQDKGEKPNFYELEDQHDRLLSQLKDTLNMVWEIILFSDTFDLDKEYKTIYKSNKSSINKLRGQLGISASAIFIKKLKMISTYIFLGIIAIAFILMVFGVFD